MKNNCYVHTAPTDTKKQRLRLGRTKGSSSPNNQICTFITVSACYLSPKKTTNKMEEAVGEAVVVLTGKMGIYANLCRELKSEDLVSEPTLYDDTNHTKAKHEYGFFSSTDKKWSF